MTICEVVSRLTKAKKSGKGFKAICPAHDDKSPSLSISEGSGGKVLLKCFVGCSTDSILTAIGLEMKDLFPDIDPPLTVRLNGNGSHSAPKAAKVIDTVYEYKTADGELLYENVRYRPKDFRQRRPDGNGEYIWGLGDVNRVPYRLPELTAAINNGTQEIWFTEGEKDADNLRLLGLTATSFKRWKDNLNPLIKGSHAVLFTDHDKAGVKQANDAARIIVEVAASVKVIDLFAGKPLPDNHGQDVSDWIETRRSEGLANEDIAERLAVKIKGSRLWQDTPTTAVLGFNFQPLSILLEQPPEHHEYIWDDILIVGGFSIVSGKPKSGKSTAMRCLAASIIDGEPFLGKPTRKGRVLYLCLEERSGEIVDHFRRMGVTGDDLLIHAGTTPQDAIQHLAFAIAEHEPIAVFIDPMSRILRAKDFNDYAQMSRAFEPIIDLARKTNVHIQCLHHDGKSDRKGGDALLGSTAIFGAVDSHIQVRRGEKYRAVSSTQRYGTDLPETVIELDPETGWVSANRSVAEIKGSEAREAILEVFAGVEKLTREDVKERVSGIRADRIVKTLTELHFMGSLHREGAGKKGDPFVFWLPECRSRGSDAVPENPKTRERHFSNVCNELGPEKNSVPPYSAIGGNGITESESTPKNLLPDGQGYCVRCRHQGRLNVFGLCIICEGAATDD